MKQVISIGLAALLLGSVGGFLVGKAGRPSGGGGAATAEPGARLVRESNRDEGSARRTRVNSVEAALREPNQLARLQSLMDLYAGMDAAQLEAAAGQLDTLPMGDRIMASMLLFSQWGEIDPMGALAYTKTMGFGGMFAKPTVLRSWASVDPVNAAKYFTENPNDFAAMGGRRGPGGDDSGAGVVAREWAKLDPQAALEWAQGLEGRDKSTALVSVLGEMAVKDPAEAAGVAAGLDGDDRRRAFSEIAEKWALKDYASAEAWINTLSGDEKQDAMGAAIGVLAKTDPIAASEKLVAMGSGRDKERAIREIGSSWAREAPAKAAEWVATQEGGADGMRSVMATWAGQDGVAALDFIEKQPVGEMRDSAAQGYLWTNRTMPASKSVSLAASITDEETRNRAIWMTTGRWMREDEAAATAYVQQSPLINEDFKEKILSGEGRDERRGWRR